MSADNAGPWEQVFARVGGGYSDWFMQEMARKLDEQGLPLPVPRKGHVPKSRLLTAIYEGRV